MIGFHSGFFEEFLNAMVKLVNPLGASQFYLCVQDPLKETRIKFNP